MTQKDRARLMTLATYASVSVAGCIIIAKLIAWFATDSLTLLSSLVDSILDIIASLLNLFAVRLALSPPDENHRFGHGKAEKDIAVFAQSAFIGLSALIIAGEAVRRILHPVPVEHTETGIAVMLFSVALTFALVLFQRYVVKRTDSSVVEADYVHYISDILVNGSVILVLAASSVWQGGVLLDPVVAFGIALYIGYTSARLGRRAVNHLMDTEFDESERDAIKRIILSHPEAKGLHNLKTRNAGGKRFIQFHLELSPHMTLKEAHVIADTVEAHILKEFKDAEVMIHQDPENTRVHPLQSEQVKAVG